MIRKQHQGTNARRIAAEKRERRRQMTAQSVRRSLLFAKKMIFPILIIGALIGGWMGARSLFQAQEENKTLQAFVIRGDLELNPDDVMAHLGLEYGQSISQISLDSIYARLEMLQRDVEYHVKIIDEQKIQIEVVPQRLLARVYHSEKGWMELCESGKLTQSEKTLGGDLPIVQTSSLKEINQVALFLKGLERSMPAVWQDVSQVVKEEDRTRIFFNSMDMELVVSLERKPQLAVRRFVYLLNFHRDKLKELKVMDLRFSGFAFVS